MWCSLGESGREEGGDEEKAFVGCARGWNSVEVNYRFYFYLGFKYCLVFLFVSYSPGIAKLLTPLMQPALTYEDPFVLLPILAVATATVSESVKMVRSIIYKGILI